MREPDNGRRAQEDRIRVDETLAAHACPAGQAFALKPWAGSPNQTAKSHGLSRPHAGTKSFRAARPKAYRLKRFSRGLAQRFGEKTNGSEAEIRIRPRGRHTLHQQMRSVS